METWTWNKPDEKLYIAVMTNEEWADAEEKTKDFCIRPFSSGLHYCRMVNCGNTLMIQMEVPAQTTAEADLRYRIWIGREVFLVVGDHPMLAELLETLVWKLEDKEAFPKSWLLEHWFLGILKQDLEFLQSVEVQITGLEEKVLEGACPQFHAGMLPMKKKIARFYRYYNQLVELGQKLEGEYGILGEEEAAAWIPGFKERCSLLAGQTQIMREYMIQVQEVYQSEIEIRQNDVMKALTMVTTICFPLTLVAGWYGMNFKYMPEIYSRYGYPAVILISVIIILISLFIFKKKKFW